MRKRIMSLVTAAVMLCSGAGIMPAAAGVEQTGAIEADKTAQWRNNAEDGEYDLRIHGWKEWETAAYMGFTLPDDFDAESIKKAELHITTKSGNQTGTAYIYSADYDAFENGGQYTGSEEMPSYDTTEFRSFISANTPGEITKIDVTDAVKESRDGKTAFRIDVKSQNTNNKWVIGSCTNDIQAPQLVLITDGVELNKDELTLVSGGTPEALTAEIYGDNYSREDLVWSSDSPETATVENGIVTPHAAGTANITVSVSGTEFSDTCVVNVVQSAESIMLSQETMTLSVGGADGELSAIVLPDNAYNKSVIWKSDDTSVAKVSSNGIVTPVSEGKTMVTAALDDGTCSASCAVTVAANVPVTGISFDKSSMTLPEKGALSRISVSFAGEEPSNKQLIWSSDDETVATVLDGVVTSVNPGTAVVTAKSADGDYTASCSVTVQAVNNMITNDEFWKDTDGNNIYSQGGGIFKFGDKYYWYGVEYKIADEYAKDPAIGGEFSSENRTFIGFTCYSSADLVNWDFEGYAMTRETEGMEDAGWVGRMGVVYNKNTQKYVLVSQKYPGIMFATSDTPEGPYKYEKLIENVPYFTNGSTGDQTLFQDDDGRAYLICSSAEGRQYLYVAPLRESDFLDIDADNVAMIYRDSTREYLDEHGGTAVKDKGGIEGNSLFKYNGHYYFTGSDLYGWNSSRVYVLESDNIMGPYDIQPIGENKNMPYIMRNVADNYAHNSQAGFYVTVQGSEQETVLYCGDRWSDFANNGLGYNQWVPLSFDSNNAPYFNDLSQWIFDIETGTWEAGAGNNYISNPEFDADRITVSSPVGWETSDNVGGAANHNVKGGARYGEFVWEQNADTYYTAELKQEITGLPDGEYTLKAWVRSSGGQNVCKLYAKDSSGEEISRSLKGGMTEWTEVTLPGSITVTDGKCEIGLYSDSEAGNWVQLDNLSLTKNTASVSRYDSGVLEIGESVNFDFGASADYGSINVKPTRDYFEGADGENGLTYGFLGLGENGYSKADSKYDSFEMVKDQQISLKNGGNASEPGRDNVYAENSILAPESTAEYDMADGTVPIRFAMKSDRHSYYNVKVTVSGADPEKEATINLFNEKRHPVATNYRLGANETHTFEFTANVMDVYYKNDKKSYEDDMLNIVLTGENAGLASVEITRLAPENAPKTIWVCSDSTGCDQPSKTPFYALQNYCGVGQYLSKYLTDMTVSNQGEGGLASVDNAHFNSAVSQWKSGDYLYVEYGHNENSTEEYKSNLDKYYKAAHNAGVKLILVGPIDRIQDGRFNEDGQWTSSLNGYSNAAREYVEEKIASGADDIAFIDLNAAWIEFLNNETERIAEVRYEAGLDTEKTPDIAAPRYYYTYNKSGAADRTHINDYGADNAASIFFKQLKNTVAAGEAEGASESMKKQAAVLRDIYDDIDSSKAPDRVSEEVIKDGYAPNSHYPENFASRTEYPYSVSIEDIAINPNGTLDTAKVRILQDIPQYAAVYVTAYSEENEIIGTVASSEHIDNTSDKAGTVKELAFDSDVVPHHFKAVVYYCDQDNNRLTDDEYKSAVSPKYESRKVIETLLDDDWSALEDETSLFGNGWNSYGSMKNKYMTKHTDTDGESYAELSSSDGNSSYIWTDLPKAVTSGKLEIRFKLRAKSGTVNIGTGTSRRTGSYGTVNTGISVSGTSVKNNNIDAGTINTGEWIDYKYLIDLDNSHAELYIGAYGTFDSDITLNTKEIAQIMIDAASRMAYETDIKDIKVCMVETYDFAVKDAVPIDDPEDMDEIYRASLHFGGKTVSDEEEGIFGKTSEVYLLGNSSAGRANCISDTEKGASTSANMYASINIAMESGSNALLQFGQAGPGTRYQALDFKAGSADTDETISVTAGEKNRTSTVTVTLKPEMWYNVEYKADLAEYNGYVTVTDILSGEVVLTADADNAWGAFSTSNIYWNSAGSSGNVYIANSWLYSKPCGSITADNDNVTLTGIPTLEGQRNDVTVTANDGYTLESVSYNGEEAAVSENTATVTVRGTADEQKINVILSENSEDDDYCEVTEGFKDRLAIKRETYDGGIKLTVYPLDGEALPELTLYRAAYNNDMTLSSVDIISGNMKSGEEIEFNIPEIDLPDGKAEKLMLWTDLQESVMVSD